MKTIQEIDLAKSKIESKYIPPLKKIFKHMAEDAKALYQIDKRVNAPLLAKNYDPEFLKVIRDMQRETIKYFGFDIRDNNIQKGFKTEKQKLLFDYHIETKDIEMANNNIDKVNRDFILEASLFIANNSENQVAYIQQTNINEIQESEKAALLLFTQEVERRRNSIEEVRHQIRQVEFEQITTGSDSIATARKKKLNEQLEKEQTSLQKFVENKDDFIGNNIEDNIIGKSQSRSELISSQNVGSAESWARQKEAEIVGENVPEIILRKTWRAILDGRTRATHVIADGQTVGIKEMFNVGGYKGKMPRDPNLPIQETAWCRCIAIYGQDNED